MTETQTLIVVVLGFVALAWAMRFALLRVTYIVGTALVWAISGMNPAAAAFMAAPLVAGIWWAKHDRKRRQEGQAQP